MRRCGVALLLTLAAAAAGAAPIYRCGQTYSQTPCPNGRLIDSADPRSAAQRAEARRVAAEERRLAARMARERRAMEAAHKPAGAAGFDSRAASAPAEAASQAVKGKRQGAKTKPAPAKDFVAVDPTARKSSGR